MEGQTGNSGPLNPEQRKQLSDRYGLSELELGKLLEDLWLLTHETPEAYALRRHEELRAAGVSNDRGFAAIARELESGRFASPELSLRQIRRIIYG
jgi:hypothetical protein